MDSLGFGGQGDPPVSSADGKTSLNPTIVSASTTPDEVVVVEESLLRSTLVPKEVIDKYFAAKQKLKKEMAHISLDDHLWFLKSFDHNGVGIIKIYCQECKKDFRGSGARYGKIAVMNLFTNFKKSHILSNPHIQHWCDRKGIDWNDWCKFVDHSTSKGKPKILTTTDHR